METVSIQSIAVLSTSMGSSPSLTSTIVSAMAHSNTASIILGCTVAVVSSAIQSLGITLQRKSHLLGPSDTPTDQIHAPHKHLQRQKRNMWLFGFLLFIVANILGSLIQISTLPLIILSPLQSIGLIFNSVLSCLLLPGEHFTRKLGLGTVVIAFGAFIIAYNGNVPPVEDGRPPSNIDERFSVIVEKLLRPSFLAWFILTFVMSAVLVLINYFVLSPRQQKVSNSASKKKHIFSIGNKFQFTKGVNYGIVSGTLTAHTFLFAKSIIDVIIESILSSNKGNRHSWLPSRDATPWILLLIMLAIIGFQLTAFNLGLKQISTSILYPLCFLIYNMFNLINDILFNSLLADHRITYTQLTWIIIGLIGVLFGVVVISWDSAFAEPEDIDSRPHDTSAEGAFKSDDVLMYMEFPYQSARQDECTKLLSSSEINTELNDDSFGSGSDRPCYESTTEQNHNLSFEQNQLLNSLDI